MNRELFRKPKPINIEAYSVVKRNGKYTVDQTKWKQRTVYSNSRYFNLPDGVYLSVYSNTKMPILHFDKNVYFENFNLSSEALDSAIRLFYYAVDQEYSKEHLPLDHWIYGYVIKPDPFEFTGILTKALCRGSLNNGIYKTNESLQLSDEIFGESGVLHIDYIVEKNVYEQIFSKRINDLKKHIEESFQELEEWFNSDSYGLIPALYP